MKIFSEALPAYEHNIDSFQQQLAGYKKKKTRIGWIRLLIVIATIFFVNRAWHSETWMIIAMIVAGIALFLYVVSVDSNLKETILNIERLIQINKEEIAVLKNDYLHREDGKEFEPHNHPYAQDLDVFGMASLYQYINRGTAEQSKQLLAASLLNHQTKETILSRQEAVKEITPKINWRQQFQSFGMANPIRSATESKINHWLKQPNILEAGYWKWLLYFYPVVTFGCLLLYLNDTLTGPVFSLLVLIFFVFAFAFSKKINPVYLILSKIVPEVNTLYDQLHHLEKESFISERLLTLQGHQHALKASAEIADLKNILNRFDIRLNVLAFFFLNTFLLWDLWQIRALNRWKNKNQHAVHHWFNAIAETELISSLAALSFNQPEWIFPRIADEHFTFITQDMGHPLIAKDKRINNSFAMNGTGKISLVTGSNMAGKSTFLRTMGVNTILALMGSVACAKAFTISRVQLMSSMRIADNLAENTSTFYAELKKLQSIIESVKRKEKIFILLDEILRGTNSLDRHTGSKALIRLLIEQHAVAVLATHDLELAHLIDLYPEAITNYHFDVQVEGEELYFDYKLKEGICQSLNASLLMKKIGIEM